MSETTNVKFDKRRRLDDSIRVQILIKADVAVLLGVTERTVDRYVQDGWLRVHRLGTGPKAPQRWFLDEVLEDIRNSCFQPVPA
jgi:hypothetical protein